MPVLVHTFTTVVARYDYDESGLTDHFSNIVHAANQPLWTVCNQSQLGVVFELVDIKADGHISKRIMIRISQWANRILPSNHTLPGDYYNTKSLVKDLGLPVEKISCVVQALLEGGPTQGKGPRIAVLRYLPLTPHLQRLYSSGRLPSTWTLACPTIRIDEGSICHPSMSGAWKYLIGSIRFLQKNQRNIRGPLPQMVLRRTVSTVMLFKCPGCISRDSSLRHEDAT
ncbi:UNVERIFIED_CONTAM: hypothetical protein Sangu_3214500 [Sesamum angustifolium]|uniref:EF-hand domain-containing protein n=1 Tax=Sesamum angustifolium TaxID=2727405 RepID=A0AAW2JK22_9LAMI